MDLQVKRKCTKCGKENVIDSTRLQTAVGCKCSKNETNITVMYFVCDECGEKIPVQIDDEITRNTRGLILVLARRVMLNVMSEGDKKKINKKRKEYDKRLTKERKLLYEKCKGHDIYEGEEILFKHLTLSQECGILW